jgi:SAM-dependent methyltransferase
MDLAWASIARAEGRAGVTDERAPRFFLESLGISEEEKQQVVDLISSGKGKIDPVVSLLLSGTCGNAYVHRRGDPGLGEYPIPRIELPAGEGRLLLDVGCNWGRWSIAASRAGYRAVGIDPSLGAVMAAQRVAAALGADVKYVVGDARWLPFRADLFDNAYSYSVLQHMAKENVRLALGELRRVLKRGGYAKIQMAAKYGVRSLQHQWRRGFREPVNFEVRYWSPAELIRTFDDLIGPTVLTTDCFFGLGWQWSDFAHMRHLHKPILVASEVFKRLSAVVVPLRRVADSVFCTATKV